jgi:hypothetical protein
MLISCAGALSRRLCHRSVSLAGLVSVAAAVLTIVVTIIPSIRVKYNSDFFKRPPHRVAYSLLRDT